MNITVLAGGLSPERDVSLSSGSLIANALAQNGHRVLLLDVYEGLPELPEDPMSLFVQDSNRSFRVTESVPDLDALRERVGNGDALIGKNVLELCRLSDAVFLALHGSSGENGQLQATLDCFGIRYTGSDYDGSLLAMDKDLSKRLFRDAGVNTPDWMLYRTGENTPDDVMQSVGLPCVVKPLDAGSSVGVSIVETAEELCEALDFAARYSRNVLVEKKITGRELTVGILGERVLPPVEIIPKEGFYDYRNKYQGNTEEICPADLKRETVELLGDQCRKAFRALRLRGYARFDFILDGEGRPWCLEANTLPGMTPTSLLPQEAQAVGISYPALCEIILRLALA